MFPKCIVLTYDNTVERDLNRPLPAEVMVRGCNQIVSSVQKEGKIARLTLRTPYDGLNDLVLELENVQNGRGKVLTATFKEAA